MLNKNFDKELLAAKKAAKEAGKIQFKMFCEKNHIIRKSQRELVSQVDMESQKVIENILTDMCPCYKVFTEERNLQEDFPYGELFWIVDPLDGTHNYVAGLPFFGVSIALADRDGFRLGVISLPAFDQQFWAVKGCGAFCNDVKISVSLNNDLSKSMVTHDNQFYLSGKAFANYQKLVEKTFTTRIIGSAVYDICLVAAGKIDARVWNHTKVFDVAAGGVLIEEAGGKITDFKCGNLSLYPKDVIASNGKVHLQISEALSD